MNHQKENAESCNVCKTDSYGVGAGGGGATQKPVNLSSPWTDTYAVKTNHRRLTTKHVCSAFSPKREFLCFLCVLLSIQDDLQTLQCLRWRLWKETTLTKCICRAEGAPSGYPTASLWPGSSALDAPCPPRLKKKHHHQYKSTIHKSMCQKD